jgi:hypothetical protein
LAIAGAMKNHFKTTTWNIQAHRERVGMHLDTSACTTFPCRRLGAGLTQGDTP